MKHIEMLLDRDEFLVTYHRAKASTKLLVMAVKNAGYSAHVVASKQASFEPTVTVLPQGVPLLDAALAKANAENKPIVLDLNAEWCAPCRKLERLTFPDPN